MTTKADRELFEKLQRVVQPRTKHASGEVVIAAAPDLLKALKSIIDEFAEDKADQDMCDDPDTLGRINRARAAIAKAEGADH